MNETELTPIAVRHPDALAQRIDAVMSDLDGTLVDTLGDFCSAINRTLADLHLPAVAAGEIALRVGKGSEHLLHSVLDWACAQVPDGRAGADPDALYADA